MDLTLVLQYTFGDVFPVRSRNPFVAYPCECGFATCYKVLLRRTVQKRTNTSRLQCPCHGDKPARGSSLVQVFMQKLLMLDSQAIVIWDSNTVPDNPKMSIDATVISGGKCAQFEIDGAHHFLVDNQDVDARKNMAMTRAGRGLMRLHYKDQPEWGKYIAAQLRSPSTTVQGTASYGRSQCGMPGEVAVVKASSG